MTSLPLALFDVGAPEALLVMFAVLILFGGQRLPEFARGLGKSLREFKRASAGVEQEIKRAIEAAPEPTRHSSKPATQPAQPLPIAQPVTPKPSEPKPPFDSPEPTA